MVTEEIITQKIETRIGELEFTHGFANGLGIASIAQITRNKAVQGQI